MEEARGSSPRSSTSFSLNFWSVVGHTLGGLVAGEGSFSISNHSPTPSGTARSRFVFNVTMASRDRPLLVALRDFLGFGSIRAAPARRERWLPTSVFTINSFKAHRLATIPFAERFLLPSAKRTQFERWRNAFEEYEREHNIHYGRSTCSVEGCSGLVRGRGLCRRHYYRATGY